jgi:hypothetical protein
MKSLTIKRRPKLTFAYGLGAFFWILFFLLITEPVLAQQLIVCDGGIGDQCEFRHLMILVSNLIEWTIKLTTVLAAGALMWVAIKLMISGGNPGAMKEAKDIAKKVLIGYMWILAAWLLVYTITGALLNDDYNVLINTR